MVEYRETFGPEIWKSGTYREDMSVHDVRANVQPGVKLTPSRYTALISRCCSQFTLAMTRTEANIMEDSRSDTYLSLNLPESCNHRARQVCNLVCWRGCGRRTRSFSAKGNQAPGSECFLQGKSTLRSREGGCGGMSRAARGIQHL